MNKLNIPETKASLWGWMLIALILSSLVSIWIVSIPDIIVAIREYFNKPKKVATKREKSKKEKSSDKVNGLRANLRQYPKKEGRKTTPTEVADTKL